MKFEEIRTIPACFIKNRNLLVFIGPPCSWSFGHLTRFSFLVSRWSFGRLTSFSLEFRSFNEILVSRWCFGRLTSFSFLVGVRSFNEFLVSRWNEIDNLTVATVATVARKKM